MMRYHVVYSKRAVAFSTSCSSAADAFRLARSLRSVGYSVDVWAVSKDYSSLLSL